MSKDFITLDWNPQRMGKTVINNAKIKIGIGIMS